MSEINSGEGEPNNRPASRVTTSDLLADLRRRFPPGRFQFPPTPDCKWCNGSGVEPARTLSSGRPCPESPCACLFFGPDIKDVTGLLAKAANTLSRNKEICK